MNDINDPPVAVDDSGVTDEDTAIAIDILDNDSDIDGTIDPTSVVFVNPPANGTLSADSKTLTVSGEGEYVIDPDSAQVTFTPEENYSGTSTPVEYQVADNDGDTVTATIDLTVDEVNDPPVAVNDNGTTDEDTSITLDVLDNDSDVDGNLEPSSVVFVNPPVGSTLSADSKTLTVPNEGEYVIDPDSAQVTFTPEENYSGTSTPVEYQVADNDGATNIGEIALTVDVSVVVGVSGAVFLDTDNSGDISNDDSGVENATLSLYALNDDGNIISSPIATTTTDNTGFYEFSDLLSGDYVISRGLELDGDENNRIELTVNNTDSDGYDFLDEPVDGTASPDVLIGTSISETISGYKGQDTLTGGGGSDKFVYTETSDGIDIITDFTPGKDRIDLSQIMSEEPSYAGSDPIGDSFVVLDSYDSVGTMIQIDFDNNGELLAKDVVFLEGVDADNINPDTDLIF